MTRTLTRSFTVDTSRPGVRILGARSSPGGTGITFVLGEPARLRIKYTTGRWSEARSVVVDRPAGRQRIWRSVPANRVRIIAADAAGNVGRAGARVR